MAAPGFGDVVRMIEIANQIYTYGFTKSHHAHVLYEEFGENIRHLALNLGDLQKVIEFITRDGKPQALDSVYFDSLCDIIGNYQTTLQDCNNLLRGNAKFRWRGDFIYNIIWNVTVASDIQGLKDRLAYLNIKLLTMLKTLDLGMAQELSISITRVHRDLASRIDAARDEVIQHVTALRLDIQGGRTGDINDVASSTVAIAGSFNISVSLEDLFKQQIQDVNTDSSKFPLVRGLDAVVYHINEINKVPADSKERKKERQWLEGAKAAWILNQVKAGQEYDFACSFRPSNSFERQMKDIGITIASYVRSLEIELVNVAKTSDLNNFIPDPDVIRDTFRNNSEMWLDCKKDIAPTPSWELEFSEKIMSASLKGPYQGFDQSLHLFRLTEVDLKLVITDIRSTGGPGERNNNIINVDLERSRYIPLYATTTSSSSALNVNFQGDRLAAGGTALSFKKRTDLFRFQHAITGHQVVFEALNIKVASYVSRLFGGPRREYTGRLQLWRAKPLKNSTADTSSSSASSASPTSVTPPTTTSNDDPVTRMFSGASTYHGSSSNRRDSAVTIASKASPGRRTTTATTSSAFSIATTHLKTPTSNFQTSIVDKEGNVGITLNKPLPSMLVLYLEESKRSSGPKELSFLAIQLDEEAVINTSACKCRKPDTACKRSVIQRRDGKPLVTYRHEAGSDLDAWNLAKLGQWQRESLSGSGERMMWAAVDFDTVEEKVKFGNTFEQLKTLLIRQKSLFNMDLTNFRLGGGGFRGL